MAKKKKKDSDLFWKQQLDFVEHSINDPKVPEEVRGILTEWLSFKGKQMTSEYNKNKKKE